MIGHIIHFKLWHTYSLIPDSLRSALHVKLGKILWTMSNVHLGGEWMIYMSADQLHSFSNLQTTKGSVDSTIQIATLGVDVARLCLEVANLFISKAALFPAVDMLLTGRKYLETTTSPWKNQYDLTLELSGRIAETACRIGMHDEAMDAVNCVFANAKCLEDEFRAQCSMLECITSGSNRDYALGVEKSLEILERYEEKVPKVLLPGRLFLANQKLRSKLPR
jgi:hypothetical protein